MWLDGLPGRALCVAAQGEAEAVARDLMSQMRHRYTLGYLPQAQAPDGTYRTLKVVAKGGERLRVTTRKGYRATLAR